MAHGYVIPVIIILILIIALIVTGYIYDPLVVIPSVAIIGFLAYRMFYVIVKTRKRNIYTYKGKIGKAIDDIPRGKIGYVVLEGEYWEALALDDIRKGDTVKVEDMRDLKLIVKRNIDETIV
ncbi:NfeD family protein [Metallosphaera sp.]|uniref:NfeD family protein n=1 Tax=Metallosphaera sp. TaxID=2020860 RepID=UPI00315EAC81